jgi:hypothetical protein
LNSALTTKLTDYVLTTALTTKLASYVLNSALTTTLSNYVLNSALITKLADYRLLTNNTFGTIVVDTVNSYWIRAIDNSPILVNPNGQIVVVNSTGTTNIGSNVQFQYLTNIPGGVQLI